MKKKDYFIPKMYRRLLVPSMIGAFSLAVADVADAFVLGRRLGEAGLAAVSFCVPVFMLINLLMDGFGQGGCVRFSKLMGEGRRDEAVACFNRIWITVLAGGILLGILGELFAPQILLILGARKSDPELFAICETYLRIITLGSPILMLNIVFSYFLRNDNHAGLAGVGLFVGCFTDIALNVLLVLVLDMGAAGAALSTVLGSFVAVCIYLPAIISKRSGVLRLKLPGWDGREVLNCFKTGASVALQSVYQLLFVVVVNNLLMEMDGKNAVAIFELVSSVSYFIIYPAREAAAAAQPLVSTFYGGHNDEDCREVLRILRRAGLIVCFLVSAAIFTLASRVAELFQILPELIPMAGRAIRIYCGGFLFVVLNRIYEQYYEAREEFRPAFLIVIMTELVVLLPCALILSRFGVDAIWWMHPVAEGITFGVSMVLQHFWKKAPALEENRLLRMTVDDPEAGMKRLLDECQNFCERWDASSQQQYFVTLIVEELAMTIFRNAIRNDPNGKLRVTVASIPGGDFCLHILDNAVKFDPLSFGKEDSKPELDFDEISMTLVKKKAKVFLYRQHSGFNFLTIQV